MKDAAWGLELDTDGLGKVLSRMGDGEGRVHLDPETVEQDLARLVLALMEFLRQLMELQAIRRMENGTLSPQQEEALGTTLQRAEGAIHDMARRFGLSPGDLVLDLGPLGRSV
jgi:hypothetical protein